MTRTATVAPNSHTSAPRILRGYELLATILANEAVGATPRVALAEVERLTGISLQDLKNSATSLDRGEVSGIHVDAIERVAYALGSTDAREVVENVLRTSGKLTKGQYQGLLDYVAAVPPAADSAFQSAVTAYRKGMIAHISTRYVEMNLPIDWRHARTDVTVARAAGDIATAESLLEDVRRLDVDPARDLDAYAIAKARQALLEDVVDLIGMEALTTEIDRIAKAEPKTSAPEVLQKARVALRARAASGSVAMQRAYLKAAWQAVPMSTMEMKVLEAREATVSRTREAVPLRSRPVALSRT